MTTAIATDLLTPLGAYLRLREQGRGSFLLESVEQGRLGRHSFIGSGTRLLYLHHAEALRLPLVRYLRYHLGAPLPPAASAPPRPAPRPRSDTGPGAPGLPRAAAHPPHAPSPPAPPGTARAGKLRRFPDQAEHERRVRAAKEYIRAGDAFQIVVSQRAERPTSASALELYRALRRINPSPYLFLLELDGLALIGSSPETVVKCEDGRAELNPIAGSIAPGDGDAEALLGSEKDRAEHVMLVDLGRNDLSRVCLPGTVRVERFLEPERFSHITHLVSEVSGALRDGVTPFDLLRACFPAGTVS